MTDVTDVTKPKKRTLYDAFETDPAAESGGIPVEYPDMGATFIVARAGGANRRYQAQVDRKLKPHKRSIDLGVFSDELARKLLIECFADAVVLDWRGVTDREGNEIPFSRAACMKLFEELPVLFDDIREQATQVSNFLQQAREEDAGN